MLFPVQAGNNPGLGVPDGREGVGPRLPSGTTRRTSSYVLSHATEICDFVAIGPGECRPGRRTDIAALDTFDRPVAPHLDRQPADCTTLGGDRS